MKAPSAKKRNLAKLRLALAGFRDFLYIVGIQTVRILKRVRRRAAGFFRPVGVLFTRLYRLTLGRQMHKLRQEFQRIGQGFSIAAGRLKKAKEQSVLHAVGETFRIAGHSLRRHRRMFATALNIAAPVAAAVLLVFTIRYWNNLNFGLELSYGGEPVGVIESENTFGAATTMVSQRLVHDTSDGKEERVRLAPAFRLTVADKSLYAGADDVCNTIIRHSSDIIEEATGLYVDGELVGAVKSSADLSFILQSVLEDAVDGADNTSAEFAQNVQSVTGLFSTSTLMKTGELKNYLSGSSQRAVTYTVKEGDTLSGVARDNNLSMEKLKSLNAGLGETLHVGELLTVEVAVPRLSVQLTREVTYEETLSYKTVVEKDASQYTDYTNVKVQGQNGTQECVDKVTYLNGAEIKRESISREVVLEPVDKVVVTGSKKRPTGSTPGESSGKLMWPVPSLHVITSPYGARWGSTHGGIDIAGGGAYGKTIVAADGGTVVSAGWNGSYGKCVIIRHANGIQTLYGHASSLLVSAGQKVAKGQAIARVGSTGNSTGPHCHFEVRVNGTRVNPRKYVNP